jgi:TonB family protein
VYGKWLIYREYDRITGVEHKPTNCSVEFTPEGTVKFNYSDSTFATTYVATDDSLKIGQSQYVITHLRGEVMSLVKEPGIISVYVRQSVVKAENRGEYYLDYSFFYELDSPNQADKPSFIRPPEQGFLYFPPEYQPFLPPFKHVRDAPTFPGCENSSHILEGKRCADEKFLQFINANLIYPTEAKKKRIEGMVVVEFMVEKDGSVSNIGLIQDIGGGCGQAALDVVSKMPRWNPGPARGRPKKIRFVLPVKFKLE